MSPAAPNALFHQMAAMMDHDPVAIHGVILAITDTAPLEMRALLASAMAASKIPSVVAASLGFVLEAVGATAIDTPIALGLAGSTTWVSSQTVDPLVRMRPWLPPTRHNQLGVAVRTLRTRAAPAVPTKPSSIYRLVATLPDGSGAASIFAATQVGAKFILNMILLKANQGVTDALYQAPKLLTHEEWVDGTWYQPLFGTPPPANPVRNTRLPNDWKSQSFGSLILVDRGMTRRGIDDKIEEVGHNVDIIPVSLSFATKMLSHGLAESLCGTRTLPFELVEVVENLRLAHVPAVASTPAAHAAELLSGLPPTRIDDTARAAAAAVSADWGGIFPCVGMWFEANEAVDAALSKLRDRKARYMAVMDEIVPTRRDFWAGRCVWLAATLREQAKDDSWIGVALVARDLAADIPLPLIGLMSQIAMIAVEAFEQNNPEPRAARRRVAAKTKRR